MPRPRFARRQLVEEVTRTILQPAVDGLRAEGYAFRWRALCRLDADRDRAAGAGIQLPLWGPGNAGHAAAAGKRSGGGNARPVSIGAWIEHIPRWKMAPPPPWCWPREGYPGKVIHRSTDHRAGTAAWGCNHFPRRNASSGWPGANRRRDAC